MRVKEENEKAGLKLNIKKKKKKLNWTKITVSSPITSWQIDGEKVGTLSYRFYFLGFQKHCRQWSQLGN